MTVLAPRLTEVPQVAALPADPAFARFVAEQGARYVRLATLLTGSRYDGEDATQDAMVAIGRAWPRLRAETLPAYGRTVVVRKALNIVTRRREQAVEQVPEAAADDSRLLRYEEDRAFFERLRHLPQQQRAVLVLRYYADFDDPMIARLLRCRESTVRSQASRALAKLRDEVGVEREVRS
jgi:RNA polymerase sigma factor (sigma-70 family)